MDEALIRQWEKLESSLRGFSLQRQKALEANLTARETKADQRALYASMIDHTLLNPLSAAADVKSLCEEAQVCRFGAVCLYPCWIPKALEIRQRGEHRFAVAVVIDFPAGGESTKVRVQAVCEAFREGADEVDIVLPLPRFFSGYDQDVLEDLINIKENASGIVKVILELSALNPEQKRKAALLAFLSGADFLKTSTGVNGKAAAGDVRLLKTVAGIECGIKAAGGIRTRADAEKMIRAGATRIGTSSGPHLLK